MTNRFCPDEADQARELTRELHTKFTHYGNLLGGKAAISNLSKASVEIANNAAE